MSTYLIGDVHGCYNELQEILLQVEFNPTVDNLWLTGDLVSRGPLSLEVLRLVRSLGNSMRMVLGNHEIHLLAVYAGIKQNKKIDRLTSIIEATDVELLINWLRHQPILQVDYNKKIVMTHAGIIPQWNLDTAIQRAHEIEDVLSGDNYQFFLKQMYSYSNTPSTWNYESKGIARLCFSINVFTRLRYCLPDGQLDMNCKEHPNKAPAELIPWFKLPRSISKEYSIIFGHWASLMGKGTPKGVYGLDTGCCWGGNLTLLRWEDKEFKYSPYNLKRSR